MCSAAMPSGGTAPRNTSRRSGRSTRRGPGRSRRSSRRGATAVVSVPTNSIRSGRLRASASVAVTQPASWVTRMFASWPAAAAWSTIPPAASASASAARVPAVSVPSPAKSGRREEARRVRRPLDRGLEAGGLALDPRRRVADRPRERRHADRAPVGDHPQARPLGLDHEVVAGERAERADDLLVTLGHGLSGWDGAKASNRAAVAHRTIILYHCCRGCGRSTVRATRP